MTPEEIVKFTRSADKLIQDHHEFYTDPPLDWMMHDEMSEWEKEMERVGKDLETSPPETLLTAIREFRDRLNDASMKPDFQRLMYAVFDTLTLPSERGEQSERLALLQEVRNLRNMRNASSLRTFLYSSYEAAAFTTPELDIFREIVRDAAQIFEDEEDTKKLRKTAALIFVEDAKSTLTKLNRVEDWAADAETNIASLPESERVRWLELFEHCRAAPAKPSGKWLKLAVSLVEQIGPREFHTRVAAWFGNVRASLAGFRLTPHSPGVVTPMADENSEVLRGLVWSSLACCDEEMSAAIGNVAIVSFRKIPGVGAVCMRLGNACVNALERLPGLAPVAHLSRLNLKVRYVKARELIARAMDTTAAREGMSKDELVEMSLPTYGLDSVGTLRESFGDYTAELQLTEKGKILVRWIGPDATPQKSIPAAVKSAHPEETKELKALIAEIEDMAGAQKERIEALLKRERQWPFDVWRERYHEHPLVSPFARRVIWNFEKSGGQRGGAIFHQGRFLDAEGAIVDGLDAEAKVELWHPLRAEPKEVLRWREWLLANEVTQPFKQAYREIYSLTEAERRTETYSNRFAAHILRQQQFAALCRHRGWEYGIRGPFESSKNPKLQLPEDNLSVEFWIESPGVEDTTDTGVYTCVSTDQVQFLRADTAIPISEVPPLTFSEVMRDIDLFVSVTSVGNDPNWLDGGLRERERTAWERFSFGDLSATAETRRDLLGQLVPKLKIAGRCSIEGKFLIVRGDLRTYKIHLGSGNILMEPNNQYLCIVHDAGKKADPKVFLPFEGDRTLSIILSKAFLLAADKKITDPSIKSQISGGMG